MESTRSEQGGDSTEPGAVTRFLHQMQNGDKCAETELYPLIYQELRRMASRHLHLERDAQTMQTTALVHEVYMKLVGGAQTSFADRAHFFRVAANAMRQILTDLARARLAQKRGAGVMHVELTDRLSISDESLHTSLLVHGMLDRLAGRNPQQAKIVELRFFGGLTVDEVAEVLNISSRTVTREWNHARVCLYEELNDSRGGVS